MKSETYQIAIPSSKDEEVLVTVEYDLVTERRRGYNGPEGYWLPEETYVGLSTKDLTAQEIEDAKEAIKEEHGNVIFE